MVTPFVNPASYTMSVTETLALPFDTSGYLDPTIPEVPITPTSTLTDKTTGDAVVLGSVPTIDGVLILQVIDGPTELVNGHDYELVINFVASPSSNKWAAKLSLFTTA